MDYDIAMDDVSSTSSAHSISGNEIIGNSIYSGNSEGSSYSNSIGNDPSSYSAEYIHYCVSDTADSTADDRTRADPNISMAGSSVRTGRRMNSEINDDSTRRRR